MDFPINFIYASPEYATYQKHQPAPYLRKSFTLAELPKKAEIIICGLGFYKLFINGTDITKGALAPYISNPDHIIYYDRYDITELLANGENVVGVILGNGMQNAPGGQIWDFEKARFRGAPRLAAAVEADGEKLFESDESFKTHPSPILFDDLRSGVFYDARNEIDGWSLPGFDDSSWDNAVICEKPRGEARGCNADVITKCEKISPVSITPDVTLADYSPRHDIKDIDTQYKPTEKTGYLYDFGVNSAGIYSLHINGRPGQEIVLQFLELIDKNGNPSYQNINFYPDGYSQRDIYICKGGEAYYEPDFTYHGYQYCLVMGIDDNQATPDLLTYIVMNSDIDNGRGSFECSDTVANKLQAMVRRSDLANFYYFPTDCPHREKNGWTGDASMSAEHQLLGFSPEKSYHEWLNNIRKAQKEDGSLPGIIPTGGWGYQWGNGPVWDSVLTWIPYYTYIYRGDIEILKENADAIFRYINYISNRRGADGLIKIGLGDWVSVGRAATHYKSPLELTDTLASMSICKYAARIFDVLGKKAQKAFAETIYNELRACARERLIEPDGITALGRCQTSQAAAIFFDLFESSEKPAAFKVLLDLIHEADDHIDVGMIGIRVIFHVLASFGEAELAYKMITRPDYPSYGRMVECGATSLWEQIRKNDQFGASSLNHHFLGDISNFFMTKISGITVNPYGDNPAYIDIRPAFIAQLTHAKAHYDTVKGRVECEWKRNGESVTLTVFAADGTDGRIFAPSGYKFVSDVPEENDMYVLPLKTAVYTLAKK